jgi:amidohydrolase
MVLTSINIWCTTMDKNISTALDNIEPWVIDIRRYLHTIPEIGFQEKKTSAFVEKSLKDIGYTPQTGIAKTGIKAVLDTGRLGKTILLRADMDGLKMTEETGLPFASAHDGYMHGCGHDAHIAMLLGAAKLLWQVQDKLKGKIIFIFQPAEEGMGGAKVMLDEGVLEGETVDYAFAQHVWPNIPLGTIGIKEGNLWAAVNHFEIIIHGKGGHGAMPHQCVDALEVGTQVVSGLQRLSSRKIDPLEPVVVTIGTFNAGTAFNIIPEKAELTGTTRTYNYDIWQSWDTKISTVVDGICKSMGATYEFTIDAGYPPLVNNQEAIQHAEISAAKVVGSKNIIEPEPTMAAEDMSFFHQQTKGGYILLGCGTDKGKSLHNPQFFCPEEALRTGVAIHCQLIFDLLG